MTGAPSGCRFLDQRAISSSSASRTRNISTHGSPRSIRMGRSSFVGDPAERDRDPSVSGAVEPAPLVGSSERRTA